MFVDTGGRLRGPPVFLAPMAGISDAPFRALALRHGADGVTSEMVASGEVLKGSAAARAKAEIGVGAARKAVQLAGCEPAAMAEAARFCAGGGASVIDINFGCPAKKVTGGWSGSALMREPDRALSLVEAVVAAVEVPVTVKMRLGCDETCLTAPGIARRAAAAGVRGITVHARTRAQFYRGRADWPAVRAVVAAAGVPVVVNGDIVDVQSARAALAASGAAGVMVGRCARGRPWLAGRIAAELAGRLPAPAPSGSALADWIVGHYEAMPSFYGRQVCVRVARKHLGWYLEAIPLCQDLRREILTATDPAAVIARIRDGLSQTGRQRAAA